MFFNYCNKIKTHGSELHGQEKRPCDDYQESIYTYQNVLKTENKTNLPGAPIISLLLKYFHYLFNSICKNLKVSGAALPKIRYNCFLRFDILPFLFSVSFFYFFHNLWANLKGAYNISLLPEYFTNSTDILLQLFLLSILYFYAFYNVMSCLMSTIVIRSKNFNFRDYKLSDKVYLYYHFLVLLLVSAKASRDMWW